jgi:hypothetical protein
MIKWLKEITLILHQYVKIGFQEGCCDSMGFKIAPSNSQKISCLNFILIPTQVVISKPDSNLKHGPTMKFNGMKMK